MKRAVFAEGFLVLGYSIEIALLHIYNLFNGGNIRIDHHGIVGIVHNESGLGAGRLLHMLLLDIVDFYLILLAALGVVGGETGSLFESAVWQFLSFRLDNNVGTGFLLGVEPPVVAGGEFEGQLVVLEIVFSHIDMKAVAGEIVKGL